MMTGLLENSAGEARCAWAGADDTYVSYHDAEWGQPVTDDRRLFEKICLEGFQSGLSWLTILRKRDNFRRAFHDFDARHVAAMGAADVERLLGDAGIVRHRGKIESTINNARRAVEMVEREGSLARFFWSFEPSAHDRPHPVTWDWIRANPSTPASTALSRELKKRGWSFVGPTTVYAFMQAMGLVNDHVEGCLCRERCETMRAGLRRP